MLGRDQPRLVCPWVLCLGLGSWGGEVRGYKKDLVDKVKAYQPCLPVQHKPNSLRS